MQYLYQNIIFKFALDTGEPQLYGTRSAFAKIHPPPLIGNDEEAMKVAAHELKGYSAFVSRVDGKIKFAVRRTSYHCCIGTDSFASYCAPSIISATVLWLRADCQLRRMFLSLIFCRPINTETLKYGSYNAGVIVKTDPIVHSVMCEVAQRLNLRLHQVIPRV